jgi:hypothetical protein
MELFIQGPKEPLLDLLFQVNNYDLFTKFFFLLIKRKKRSLPNLPWCFFCWKNDRWIWWACDQTKEGLCKDFIIIIIIILKAIIVKCLRFMFKATQNVHPLLHKKVAWQWFCELFFYIKSPNSNVLKESAHLIKN